MFSYPRAVPNHRASNCRVSLPCPPAKYCCSAQSRNIRRISQQCPTAEYPCKATVPDRIPPMPHHGASPQSSTAEYPCNGQPQCIQAVPNQSLPSGAVPTATYPCSHPTQSLFACSAQPQSIRVSLLYANVSLQCPTSTSLERATPERSYDKSRLYTSHPTIPTAVPRMYGRYVCSLARLFRTALLILAPLLLEVVNDGNKPQTGRRGDVRSR